jgi:glucosamine--fructose-6-phosphate aminotransferase (isomerizing)
MYKQIQSLPELIWAKTGEIDTVVRESLEEEECQKWERVILVGCGDSYYTALATEWCWEKLAGIAAEPMTSFYFSRYAVPFTLPNTVLFAISNSGEVARSIEALILAKGKGLKTFAVTSNPTSRLASMAHKTLSIEIPPLGISPGVRSYAIALLTIFYAILQVGEKRGSLTPTETNSLKEELSNTASLIEKTIPPIDSSIKALAPQLASQGNFVFLGGGPNYSTALFSAAKIIEACGVSALGQDIEEWAHIQCFTREEGTPTFIIAPNGSSYQRTRELIPAMREVGRKIIIITDCATNEMNQEGVEMIKIEGKIREEFSPLIYPLPGEFLAYYLAEIMNESFFRLDRKVGPLLAKDVRQSKIIEKLADLPIW